MEQILFGAFDPLYPNGLISCANAENMFGVRLITRDEDSGALSEGRTLDFSHLKIGPIDADRYYQVSWLHGGKRAQLTWARIDEQSVWGQVELDAGLSVVLEAYIPREYRLKDRWVNFSRQAPRIITGEMISPYEQNPLTAMRLLLSQTPLALEGYNDREEQLCVLRTEGRLRHTARGDIWNDMGLWWLMGAQFDRPFSFLYSVGDPADFLQLPDAQQIERLLEEGRARAQAQRQDYLSRRLTGVGALSGIPDAVETPIRFNTMYREDTRHRFAMVDRPWARAEDDWGITFNWDTFLSSLSANWFDSRFARENILCGFDMQLPDGRIPLNARVQKGHRAEPPIMAGRGQHIVQGYAVWQTYLWTRDKAWLSECYEKVQKTHGWWLSDRGDGQAWRDALGWGLIGFGYDPEKEMGVLGARVQPYVAKAQYAYFETYDDSPQWTDGVFFKTVKGLTNVTERDVTDRAKYLSGKNTVNMYTLERCCLYALDAECLALIADQLGKPEDAVRYRAEHQAMAKRVNERMWDEADGCYYNLSFDGTLSRVLTPDCFMPIMAGIAPADRAERLKPLLLNEKTFWGRYKMPSVSRSDPAYADQKYWRGQIWPPQVLWTYLSLRRAGWLNEAWALAQTAGGMLLREWSENNYCPENYNGDTGRLSGSPHYNWGTLMGEIALSELMQLTPDALIFGHTQAPDGTGLRGIAVDGHVYDVQIENGLVTVWRDGAQCARGEGPVRIKRD